MLVYRHPGFDTPDFDHVLRGSHKSRIPIECISLACIPDRMWSFHVQSEVLLFEHHRRLEDEDRCVKTITANVFVDDLLRAR
jgi:hypothetical protein